MPEKILTAPPLDLSTPYKCGFDCGRNGLCNANKRSRFEEIEDLAEWDRGYKDGSKS